VKKCKLTSDDEDDFASKDDEEQPDDNDHDYDHAGNNTAKPQTAQTNRRRRRGESCHENSKAVASSTTAKPNSKLDRAWPPTAATSRVESIKHEVEMEVDVELEEEEESRAQLLCLASSPLQQQLSLEEGELREAERQLEEAGRQLPPDQLVYDFRSSDYLLPFDDQMFYMDQEERLVPSDEQLQQQQHQQLLQQQLDPFLPDRHNRRSFDGGMNDLDMGPSVMQPVPATQFTWSPLEAPPAASPLPGYDQISPSSSFDKDRDVNIEVLSGRLVELQPQPLTSCPRCHCDLSCTAAAVIVNPPPSQLSCDSFLSFPENSLDIEKFL